MSAPLADPTPPPPRKQEATNHPLREVTEKNTHDAPRRRPQTLWSFLALDPFQKAIPAGSCTDHGIPGPDLR